MKKYVTVEFDTLQEKLDYLNGLVLKNHTKEAMATVLEGPGSKKISKKTTAKKAGKKKAGKKKAKRKTSKASEPKPASTPKKEVDVGKLSEVQLVKRVKAIYKLEKSVEGDLVKYAAAKRGARAAKARLAESKEALEHELTEQRYGPGPLFNPEGTGAAEGAGSGS